MIKLKNQLNIIYLCLITFIGILFVNNNNLVMAMNNNKHQQKSDIDIIEEAVEQLKEGIEYFNKKEIKIHLSKIKELLYNEDKRKHETEEQFINSKNNKKAKK